MSDLAVHPPKSRLGNRPGEAAQAERELRAFVAAVRRRVRARRALLYAAGGLVLWGASAVALLVVARLAPLGWERPAAALLGPVLVGARVAVGLAKRLTPLLAARAADSDLAADDRLATAYELLAKPSRSSLEEAQLDDAAATIAGVPAGRASPLRLPRTRLAIAAALVTVAALLLYLPNPMDEVVSRRRAERALLEEESQELLREAQQVEKAPLAEAESERLVRRLRKLAAELQSAPSLEEALDRVAETEARLASESLPDHLASRALMASFERSLERSPLSSGLSGSVPEQLAALAAQAAEMGTGERAAASSRLEGLAASLAAADPRLASTLAEAAGSLAAGGDPSALDAAAGTWNESLARLSAQDALTSARGSLAGLRARLSSGQAALAAGKLPGAGQGQGSGQGQGQGQGSGQGQGQGQGAGLGGQGGGGAGRVGGNQANSAGAGRGGPGSADGVGSTPRRPSGDAPVYDPIFGDAAGEDVRVSGNKGPGRSQTVGAGLGPGSEGEVLVPYRSVYARWSRRAADNVEALAIPASLRDYVRAYFESLAPSGQP